MRFYLLLLFIACLFAACPSEDDNGFQFGPFFNDVDLLTGIELRDENGAPIGLLGNPNNRKEDIEFYPNPSLSVATVFSLDADIAQVWFLPALQDTTFQGSDFDVLLADVDYTVETLSTEAVKEWQPGANNFTLNLENLSTGYYRIFYLLADGTLAWDNVYCAPQQNDLIAVQQEIYGHW